MRESIWISSHKVLGLLLAPLCAGCTTTVVTLGKIVDDNPEIVTGCHLFEWAGNPSADPSTNPTSPWDDPFCQVRSNEFPDYPGDYSTLSVTVQGSNGAAEPDAQAAINVVKFGDSSNPVFDSSHNGRTIDFSVSASSSGEWQAFTSDVGNLDTPCNGNCEWTPIANIEDDTRAAANTCGEYLDDLEVCFQREIHDSRRAVPVDSTCAAGSGTFQLVPYHYVDHDDDSAYSLALYPIMVSGTGELTSAAWITAATAVDTQGYPLRVARVGRALQWSSADDSLVSPGAVSRPVSPSGSTYSTGIVSGYGPFLMEEVGSSTDLDFSVSLTWTCATPGPLETVQPDTGYSFDLGDVGCSVSWPQRFTLRPIPELSPNRLLIELYGNANGAASVPLTNSSGGHNFDIAMAGFEISGTITGASPSTGMSIALSEFDYDGSSVCTAGSYTLPVEQ